jgi:hypothetical protein
MIAQELTDQLRTEIKRLKESQDKFVPIYKQLCVHHGGPNWQKQEIEMVFHRVRGEVIPIMQQAGLDPKSSQALCSWAEKLLMQQ